MCSYDLDELGGTKARESPYVADKAHDGEWQKLKL